MSQPLFWIVFNNDWPLSVCLSEDQANREVTQLKADDKSPKVAGSNITRNYFHWHDVKVSSTPLVVLKPAEQAALDECYETDGCEVQQDGWKPFEALQDKGLVRFGARRGPGLQWRRAELTDLGRVAAEIARGGV